MDFMRNLSGNFEHFTNRSLIYPQKCQSPKRTNEKKKNRERKTNPICAEKGMM